MDIFKKAPAPAPSKMSINMIDIPAMSTPGGDMMKADGSYASVGRPTMGQPFLTVGSNSKIPTWRLPAYKVFEMFETIGDLRSIMHAIQREMFKNGLAIEPSFRYQCQVCLKEFTEKPAKEYIPLHSSTQDDREENLQCDECGNEDHNKFRKPKPEERAILQALIKDTLNHNGEKLKKISREFEMDLDKIDNAYTLVTRNYRVKKLTSPDPDTGATAKVVSVTDYGDMDEMIRINPAIMTLIANEEGEPGFDDSNNPKWICPDYLHRTKLLSKPFCDTCGLEAFTAFFTVNEYPYGVPLETPKKMYYPKHEVIWTAGKYEPHELFGSSPLNAVWKKALSLFYQDEYIWKYFDKDRPPKSLLTISSRNYESVESFMEKNRGGARADPYMPRVLLTQTDDGKSGIEFIDLTPNFQELELLGLRKELRGSLDSIYGVQPTVLGDMGGGGKSGGGKGDSTIQVTLTNRTIKGYQQDLDEYFFDQLTVNIMGIKDWKIKLNVSEEIDELREQQLIGEKLNNLQLLQMSGFDAWFDGNGKIMHTSYPDPKKVELMMGGGGMQQGGAAKGDKTKNRKVKEDKATKFGGEPKDNVPSDEGGDLGSSPSSGFSYSDKALEIIQKGLVNEWTLNNMAKKLSAETDETTVQCKRFIKNLIRNSLQ